MSLSSAASQMALTSTQGQKYWHNIWTKDEIMCLALAHCLCVLPFCCLWKGRCICFFFFMTAVTNRHKQAVNEFWSQKSEMIVQGQRQSFCRISRFSGPFQLLDSVYMHWSIPCITTCIGVSPCIAACIEVSPCITACIGVSPYITLTSASAVTSLPPLLHPCYRDTCNYVRTIQIIQANLISWFNLPISVKSALLCKKTWRHNHGVWGFRLRHAGAGSTLLS